MGRLAELSAAVERLARVMDPEYVPVWMREPVAGLGDDRPLDVLARGDYRRLSSVESGLSERLAGRVGSRPIHKVLDRPSRNN